VRAKSKMPELEVAQPDYDSNLPARIAPVTE